MITLVALPLILAFAPGAVWALRAGGLRRLWLLWGLAVLAGLFSAPAASGWSSRGARALGCVFCSQYLASRLLLPDVCGAVAPLRCRLTYGGEHPRQDA